MMFRILNRIILFILSKFNLGEQTVSYGILSPCYRCSYGRSKEPIVVFHILKHPFIPRVIVNYKGKTYARRGDCIGLEICGKCINAIDSNSIDYPCKWLEI